MHPKQWSFSNEKFYDVFSGYADRLHPAYLTLQCQIKGSMGERSKPALC